MSLCLLESTERFGRRLKGIQKGVKRGSEKDGGRVGDQIDGRHFQESQA